MKQIFIGGDVAYTDATTPNGLTAGEIGIFTEDLTLITAANVADYLHKPFIIASHSTLGPRISNPIHRIKELDSNVYAVPVKQVVTISGIALVSGADKYTEYTVKVIDVTKATSPSEDKISSSVLGVYSTIALLVDALVAKINGNPNSVVTATRSTNDLVLTATDYFTNFRVALQGGLELATVTYTTPMTPGIGYGPRVVTLENDYLVYEGYRARLDRRYPAPALQASAASNYDIVALEGIYTANAKHGMDALYNRNTLYILAMVTTSDQKTAIDTILSTIQAGYVDTDTLPE